MRGLLSARYAALIAASIDALASVGRHQDAHRAVRRLDRHDRLRRTYPAHGTAETARRRAQIAAGRLTASNGLRSV